MASRPLSVPSGSLSRLARIGSMTTAVGANMALNGAKQWTRGEAPAFRDLLMTPGNIKRIADDLARLRGAAMKVGQLLSMESGEMLPPELAEILGRLRADADFMPPKQLKRVLNDAWGPSWLGQFHRFDVQPIAAASIGQVHRATTKDGRTLAIKVQYPGVARSIDADVTNVGALVKVSGLMPKGFDIGPYLVEARKQLHQEADYLRESACLAEFRDLLAGDERFILPELEPDLTRQTVLAMSFVPSEPIESLNTAPQDIRDRVMAEMFELLLRELFEFGVMQTDPNFANFRYDPETGSIVLLDFGAVRRFEPWVAER